jgi:hypothetical protein
VVLALVLFGWTARSVDAQTVYYSNPPQTIVSGAVLTVTSTNSPAEVINCSEAATVAVQVYSVGNAKGTNGITIATSQSLDSTYWVTGPTISYTATGATAVNIISNFTVSAVKYLRVDTIIADGTAAAGATNTVTVKAFSKKGL